MDASGRIAADVECLGCGYNLRTLPADGLCPECARPVVDSLRAHPGAGASDPLDVVARCAAFCALALLTAPIPLVGLAVAFFGVPAWLGFAIEGRGAFDRRLDRGVRFLAGLTALLTGGAAAVGFLASVAFTGGSPGTSQLLLLMAIALGLLFLTVRQLGVCATLASLSIVRRRGQGMLWCVTVAAAAVLLASAAVSQRRNQFVALELPLVTIATLSLVATLLAAAVYFWWARGQFAARARSARESAS